MGHVCSSICHRHAKLSIGDKVVNLVVGSIMPLRNIRPNASEESNAAVLQKCRQTFVALNVPGHTKAVNGIWDVTDETFRGPIATDFAGVRVLLHIPKAHTLSGGLPLIVWAHGGGLTLGCADEQWGADFFKDLAIKMGAAQFCWASVEYRLSPEAKFPAAVDDVLQAYAFLKDPSVASRYGYDPQQLSLAGVSAGAFLAAHAALQLMRNSPHDGPTFLAALHPMADPAMQGDSHHLFGDLPMCPTSWIRWSWRALLSESLNVEPTEERIQEASLVQADWAPCKGLPVLNVVAPFDCLRDEGMVLSTVMAAGGVSVDEVHCGGSHCVSTGYPASKEAVLAHLCRMLSP